MKVTTLGLIVLISTPVMAADLPVMRRATLTPHHATPLPRSRVVPLPEVPPEHPPTYDKIAHDRAWMAEAASNECRHENDTCAAERELAWQEFLLRKYLRKLREK